MVSDPSSRHRDLIPYNFLGDCSNKMTGGRWLGDPWTASGWRLFARETNYENEGLNFSLNPSHVVGRDGLKFELSAIAKWYNQSGTSLKIQKDWIREIPDCWTPRGGWWILEKAWRGSFHMPCPMRLFHLAIHLYSLKQFIINV